MWTAENRGRYDRSRLRYPTDLTDAEWALVEPLIPRAKRGGNKRTANMRAVVDGHSTIYRWVQRYAPEMEKQLRWQWRVPRSTSWRVDETYIKVRGEWAYLYRAVDKLENTIDFYLSPTRNTTAAKHFLGKALRA